LPHMGTKPPPKAPDSEGGRYNGKERLVDSLGTIYRALRERPATVGRPYMCDNSVFGGMTETRLT